jgi:hypothetical protein
MQDVNVVGGFWGDQKKSLKIFNDHSLATDLRPVVRPQKQCFYARTTRNVNRETTVHPALKRGPMFGNC